MLNLYFKDLHAIFLAYHQLNAIVIETPLFMIFGSNHLWFTHAIIWPIQDVECGKVHCQVAFWCVFFFWSPFCEVSAVQIFYGSSLMIICMPPHSIGGSLELRYIVLGRIRCNRILEVQVYSNLPIIYLIINPFHAIRVFSTYSWYCGARKPLCEVLFKIEWSLWQAPLLVFN